MVSYTVNGLMENHHRLLLGINVERFRSSASETDGGRTLLDTFHQKHALRIQTVGADKEYFASSFLTAITRQRITPHVAPKTTSREPIHQHVRRLNRTVGYQVSQRARRKIDELWGKAKCWQGFCHFHRRGLLQARDEAYLMGWLLNFKRLATLRLAPRLTGSWHVSRGQGGRESRRSPSATQKPRIRTCSESCRDRHASTTAVCQHTASLYRSDRSSFPNLRGRMRILP